MAPTRAKALLSPHRGSSHAGCSCHFNPKSRCAAMTVMVRWNAWAHLLVHIAESVLVPLCALCQDLAHLCQHVLANFLIRVSLLLLLLLIIATSCQSCQAALLHCFQFGSHSTWKNLCGSKVAMDHQEGLMNSWKGVRTGLAWLCCDCLDEPQIFAYGLWGGSQSLGGDSSLPTSKMSPKMC